jgi:hypothetical protein
MILRLSKLSYVNIFLLTPKEDTQIKCFGNGEEQIEILEPTVTSRADRHHILCLFFSPTVLLSVVHETIVARFIPTLDVIFISVWSLKSC